MKHLDEELRRALRREDPPAGFAERLLERLPAEPPVVVPMPARGRTPTRFTLAAAAALAVVTGGVWLAIPRSDIPKEVVAIPTSEAKPVTPAPPVRPTIDATPEDSKGPLEVTGPMPTSRPVRLRRTPRPVEDPEAIRAAEQLQIALQITGTKLNVVRREVRETRSVPPS